MARQATHRSTPSNHTVDRTIGWKVAHPWIHAGSDPTMHVAAHASAVELGGVAIRTLVADPARHSIAVPRPGLNRPAEPPSLQSIPHRAPALSDPPDAAHVGCQGSSSTRSSGVCSRFSARTV